MQNKTGLKSQFQVDRGEKWLDVKIANFIHSQLQKPI